MAPLHYQKTGFFWYFFLGGGGFLSPKIFWEPENLLCLLGKSHEIIQESLLDQNTKKMV